MKERSKAGCTLTAGLDLGDKTSYLYVLDTISGEVVEQSRIPTTPEALKRRFAGQPPIRVALETGTHSPWASQLLETGGHEVLVANARHVRLVYQNKRKSDQLDAENLARLARLDPKLLAPIHHRKQEVQADLALLKSRDALVRARTSLINHVRGVVKSFGSRLPTGGADSFHVQVLNTLPETLKPALAPLVRMIETLSEQIKACEATLRDTAKRYPEATVLQQVPGVGPITSLSFVLTLEEPQRFAKSRTVGAFLGLVPSRSQSGESDPRKSISKQGNVMLRSLLVQCANHILRKNSPDSDLKRFGERLVERGGRAARSQAVTAVARKLAVLLHRLWSTQDVYQPLFNTGKQAPEEAL